LSLESRPSGAAFSRWVNVYPLAALLVSPDKKNGSRLGAQVCDISSACGQTD
jgi:hypothetical protein